MGTGHVERVEEGRGANVPAYEATGGRGRGADAEADADAACTCVSVFWAALHVSGAAAWPDLMLRILRMPVVYLIILKFPFMVDT